MKQKSRIKNDYKTPLTPPRRARPNRHWPLRWLALGLGSVAIGVVMAKSQEPVAHTAPPPAAAAMQRAQLTLPAPPAEEPVAETAADARPAIASWHTLDVRRGDTFARLLSEAGIERHLVHALATAGALGKSLARLHPGDQLRLGFDSGGTLQRVVHRTSPERRLVFERDGDDFEGRAVEESLERRLHYAHGKIDTSLFRAGAEAGLTNRLIMDLVGIFGWDIDFVLDIRRDDRFTVVYEAFYKEGERVRNGAIVAAEFINQGRTYRAVRYTDPTGDTAYFAPDGTSMRKAFLRSPVKFTRITSRYGQRRHPVLGRMRDHDGVDYAARNGTPIRSTGDGVVVFRGRKGGYGNFIVVRHGNRYSTAYAHLRGFARGLRVGSRVDQGQVIGYVGNTGQSTGPHLHYEFRVNGVHRNPLTVEFPSVAPVAEAHREHFRAHARPLLAQLDTLHRAYAARPR